MDSAGLPTCNLCPGILCVTDSGALVYCPLCGEGYGRPEAWAKEWGDRRPRAEDFYKPLPESPERPWDLDPRADPRYRFPVFGGVDE